MKLGSFLVLGAWIAAAAGMGVVSTPAAPKAAFPGGSPPRSAALVAASMPSPPAPGIVGSGIGVPGVSPRQEVDPNDPSYNGRFTYVRIRHGDSGSDLRNMSFRGRRGRGGGRQPPWSHDYPRAEVNFAKIVDATTFIDYYMDGNAGRILELTDPDLFRYPIATIIEPGYWQPTEEDIEALRAWLLKGGFLIADDFRGDWDMRNLIGQLQRALPNQFVQQVPLDHEIFNSFFYIEDPLSLPSYGRDPPSYWGIFEDNDAEDGRIMVMIGWNQDIQEYWEFSDMGYYPIDLSNEAYQFGVNYLIYAMTH